MSLTFHSLSHFTFLHKIQQFLKTRVELKGLFKWWKEGVEYTTSFEQLCHIFTQILMCATMLIVVH